MSIPKGPVAVATLAVLTLALFLISGIPRFRDATGGADDVIGEICWIGFLVGVLALIIIGVAALVNRLRGVDRHQAAGR